VRLRPATLARAALIALLITVLWPVQFGGRFAVTIVAGDSMEPTFGRASVVVVWDQTVDVGDTILFRVPEGVPGEGNPVIHRVIDGGESGWVTQGDNTQRPDRWLVSDADVIGVAKFHIPFGGEAIVLMRSWLVIAVLGGLGATLLFWPRDRSGGPALRWSRVRRDTDRSLADLAR